MGTLRCLSILNSSDMSNENLISYEWNAEWAEMIQSDISRSGWTHSGMAIRNNGEIITSDNGELNKTRLMLLQSLAIVIKNGLSILGVSTPKSM